MIKLSLPQFHWKVEIDHDYFFSFRPILIKTRKAIWPKRLRMARPPNLTLTSASYDLDLWPPDPKSWSFYPVVPIGAVKSLKSAHSLTKCCVHDIGNKRMEGWTNDNVDEITPPAIKINMVCRSTISVMSILIQRVASTVTGDVMATMRTVRRSTF